MSIEQFRLKLKPKQLEFLEKLEEIGVRQNGRSFEG